MGKVTAISNNTYFFGEITLEDVFETLTLDIETDITDSFGIPADDEGNQLSKEVIESSIWESFDEDSQEGSSSPMAQTKASTKKTVAVEIVNDYFNGKLLSSVTLDSRIRIKSGKMEECHMKVHRRSALEGTFSISKSTDKTDENGKHSSEKLLKTVNFPLGPGVVIGPLVLRPAMKISAGISVMGQAAVSGSARIELENATYVMDYVNGNFVCDQDSDPGKYHFSFSMVELEAHITPFLKGAIQMALYQEKILSVGIEASAQLKMQADAAFHLEDTDLLIDNPTIRVTPELTAAAYLSSKFLGKLDDGQGRIQVSKTKSFPVKELPLLPIFSNGKILKGPDSFKVSIASDRQALMAPSEIGVACFADDKKEPVQLLPLLNGRITKAAVQHELVYEGHADYARPYVTTEDGTIYYGEIFGPQYLKSLTAIFNGETNYSYQFTYDDKKRLKEANGDLYGNFRFKYEDNRLIIETFNDDTTSPWASYFLGDDGRVIRKDDNNPTTFIYKNGGISGTSSVDNLYVFNGEDFTEFYGHNLTYTEYEDTFNLNIFSMFLITDFYVLPALVKLPGLWSKHLPATLDNIEIHYNIEDGRVNSFEREVPYESNGVMHEWHELYQFTYYD